MISSATESCGFGVNRKECLQYDSPEPGRGDCYRPPWDEPRRPRGPGKKLRVVRMVTHNVVCGRQASEWNVINRFLILTVGSHREHWTLGRPRQAAFEGIWNDLASELIDRGTRVVTDSNMNTSCVFEVDPHDDVLYLSTVLPFFTVWSGSQCLDQCPDWAKRLTSHGFSYLGSRVTETLSPYRDDEAERRLTYFEMLFEWTEGSDGPSSQELIDPWVPDSR